MSLRLTWDENKNAANVRKHRVSFAEASEVFFDPFSTTVLDKRHDASEHRYFTMGVTRQGLMLSVGHTDDGEEIRLVTARPATLKERRQYEGDDAG